MKNKLLIIFSICLISLSYAQTEGLINDTAINIFKILEIFGIVVKEPFKAILFFLIPIFVRIFEKKGLDEQIKVQNDLLAASGLVKVTRKTIFRRIWESFRFRKKNNDEQPNR